MRFADYRLYVGKATEHALQTALDQCYSFVLDEEVWIFAPLHPGRGFRTAMQRRDVARLGRVGGTWLAESVAHAAKRLAEEQAENTPATLYEAVCRLETALEAEKQRLAGEGGQHDA